MFLLTAMVIYGTLAEAMSHEETCYDKFEYVFKVMKRLSDNEKKLEMQERKLKSLAWLVQNNNTAEFENGTSGQEEQIVLLKTQLKDVMEQLKMTSRAGGDTYTRWGRSSCPNGTALVYDGFAAGSSHTSTGGAANYICLAKQPKWNDQTVDKSWHNLICGAEYETGGGIWKKLYQNEVPCVVCHTPRSSVFMVSGRNVCHESSTLEYSGYLMSGAVSHPSATELTCVDDEPEAAPLTSIENENGRLFYFVQAKCGALKCPPYEEGKKLTCAVCSI